MRLLERLAVGGASAPNRVLFGPHETNLGVDRAISSRHVAYYERRARGGTGAIVVEEASVHGSDWPYERCPLAAECGPGWAAVARACRPHGALVLAALGHSGGQGSSAYSQAALWAPSGVPEVTSREVPKVMEPEDIAEVVHGFGEAASLAVASGLDGVEVNAGQHSLVRQFLSGLTNLRDDDYGADRLRFAREVLAATRDGVGRGRVLGLRLSCDELAPWAGITPEAAETLAGELAPLVDYLVVVRGSIFSIAATRPDMHDPPGFNLDLCAGIRRAVGGAVPVVAQGSIVDVDQAEQALVDGRADAVEMTRAQIADPDLVAKLRAGHAARIRPCLLCNQRCRVRDNRNPLVSCVVEPRSGYEWRDPDPDPDLGHGPDLGPQSRRNVGTAADGGQAVRSPATSGEAARAHQPGAGAPTDPGAAVLVVGAGPAGLECARVVASWGRAVTVAERHQPGGWAATAALASGRHRLALAATWLEAECRRLGVRFDIGREVDPREAAEHEGPVVVCSGGRDRPADYEVTAGSHVVSAAGLIANVPEPPPGPVTVWDPVGGPVAVSVAEELAAAGFTVTLVSPDVVVGTLLSLAGDLAPANVRLQQAGVRLVKRVVLRRVEPARVVGEDRFSGAEVAIESAWLVDCGHRLPDDAEWPDGVTRAGDAVAPRSIHEAILEGRRAALALVGAPR